MAFGRIGFEKNTDETADIAEINVIPLVDVLLVLLIIFMVAAPLSIGGIKVELPISKAKSNLMEEQRIILTIDKKGEFYLEKELIPKQQIEQKLKNIYQYREKKEIFIRADRTVNYGNVVDAITAAKIAGVGKVSMLTQNPGKS